MRFRDILLYLIKYRRERRNLHKVSKSPRFRVKPLLVLLGQKGFVAYLLKVSQRTFWSYRRQKVSHRPIFCFMSSMDRYSLIRNLSALSSFFRLSIYIHSAIDFRYCITSFNLNTSLYEVYTSANTQCFNHAAITTSSLNLRAF